MRCSVLWIESPAGTVVSRSAELADGRLADRRRDVAPLGDILVGLAKARPAPAEPVGLARLVRGPGLEFGLEQSDIILGLLVDPRLVDHALLDQPLAVDLADRRLRLDRRVHQRLGEARLVALVVAEAAIAPHVDDHVAAELLAELGRHLAAPGDRFGIVAVDVEDRRLDALGDVRRVRRGPPELRAGGEADLVVDDEMDRAAGAVAGEPGEAEAFPHHALARERRVAVEQHRQHLLAVAVAEEGLHPARLAEDDRDRPPRGATGWGAASGGP